MMTKLLPNERLDDLQIRGYDVRPVRYGRNGLADG